MKNINIEKAENKKNKNNKKINLTNSMEEGPLLLLVLQ